MTPTPPPINHPVLQRLYPTILTLRQYLLAKTQNTSKSRRRRIAHLADPAPLSSAPSTQQLLDQELGRLLDTALVATADPTPPTLDTDQDIEAFSQQRSQETSGATFQPGYLRQSEVPSTSVTPLPRLLTVPRQSISSFGVSSSARPPTSLPTYYAMASSGVPIAKDPQRVNR